MQPAPAASAGVSSHAAAAARRPWHSPVQATAAPLGRPRGVRAARPPTRPPRAWPSRAAALRAARAFESGLVGGAAQQHVRQLLVRGLLCAAVARPELPQQVEEGVELGCGRVFAAWLLSLLSHICI